MTTTSRILVAAAAALAIAACGSDRADPGLPLPPDSSDTAVTLPTWKLEDIQPQSPRFGQTYGLDTFAGRIVAVTLVEGF